MTEQRDVWRAIRSRFFIEGHTFAEIDSMTLPELSDVLSYMSAKDKSIAKKQRMAKMAQAGKAKSAHSARRRRR